VLHQRTSRLSEEDLYEIVARVDALLPASWERPTGRRRVLALVYAVEATVIYLRRNHVQNVIGEFYNVSQATISRIISTLTPLVRAATAREIPTREQVQERIAGRVVLLDGALARLCGGLPIALRIAGVRLASHPHWSVSTLVDLLADEHHRLDELCHGDVAVRPLLALVHDSMAKLVGARSPPARSAMVKACAAALP
jgi:hypothetical protein